MNLLKPSRLEKGAKLGIVTCSNPISIPDAGVQSAYQRLKELGFGVEEAPNCRKTYGHAAGTIKERAAAINEFFARDDIAGILHFWGGFQSHQLLEHLDYKTIARNPKPFIGYSDTTSLNCGIHAKTGLVTFLGPAVVTFTKPTLFPYSVNCLKQVVMDGASSLTLKASPTFSDNPWYKEKNKKMKIRKAPGWTTYNSGVTEGRIIGGNLGTMLLLNGTEYWPDMKNKILFVEEDEEETPKTIDRMFTQLRQMGVFGQIKGLVIGRFMSSCGFTKKDSVEMILKDSLKGYDIPVMYNVDFGHSDPLLTIPMGVKCRLDAGKKRITYLEPAVQ